jgi:hypothetical protein
MELKDKLVIAQFIIYSIPTFHTRGPTLETVVVRMRILCGAYSDKIREAGEKREGHGDHVKEIARTALVLSIY